MRLRITLSVLAIIAAVALLIVALSPRSRGASPSSQVPTHQLTPQQTQVALVVAHSQASHSLPRLARQVSHADPASNTWPANIQSVSYVGSDRQAAVNRYLGQGTERDGSMRPVIVIREVGHFRLNVSRPPGAAMPVGHSLTVIVDAASGHILNEDLQPGGSPPLPGATVAFQR